MAFFSMSQKLGPHFTVIVHLKVSGLPPHAHYENCWEGVQNDLAATLEKEWRLQLHHLTLRFLPNLRSIDTQTLEFENEYLAQN